MSPLLSRPSVDEITHPSPQFLIVYARVDNGALPLVHRASKRPPTGLPLAQATAKLYRQNSASGRHLWGLQSGGIPALTARASTWKFNSIKLHALHQEAPGRIPGRNACTVPLLEDVMLTRVCGYIRFIFANEAWLPPTVRTEKLT